MDSVKYILGKPDYVTKVGNIYPINISDYDEFMELTNVILISYKQFSIMDDEIKKLIDDGKIKLLDLILKILVPADEKKIIITKLEQVLSMVTKKTVKFDERMNIFSANEGEVIIDKNNFDEVRDSIMKQNVLFSPPIYKSKKVQEIANNVLMRRASDGINITIESMLTTLAAMTGKNYIDLSKYTIYQVKSEFQRMLKIETYQTMMMFKCVGSESTPEHFAEMIDMFIDPYSDIFKEKNALKNINQAL